MLKIALQRLEAVVYQPIVIEGNSLTSRLSFFAQCRQCDLPAAEEVSHGSASRHVAMLGAARQEHLLSTMSEHGLFRKVFHDGRCGSSLLNLPDRVVS